MVSVMCPGREHFENLIPYGSGKNICPFGMGIDCGHCKFYSHPLTTMGSA